MPIPKIVVTAALMAANMALTMTRKIEGPRLDDLKFTGGDYGVPLAMVWGLRRLQVPIFWAEDLKEIKRRRKTKGGKYNEYTYYGTWAVALAGHEIEAVRRVWFDTHLVLDLSGTGPVTPFDFGGSRSAVTQFYTTYLGTETQQPDPRMQATVEAQFGAGSCPAYRGTAYMVFKDVPLEKIGNRIPQVSVEIVSRAGTAFPSDLLTPAYANSFITFSPDYTTLLVGARNGFTIYDTASQAAIVNSAYPDPVEDIAEGVGFLSDGSVVAVRDNVIYSHGLSGFGAGAFNSFDGSIEGTVVSAVDANGLDHWLARDFGSTFYYNGNVLDWMGMIGEEILETMLFADVDGQIWICGPNAAGTEALFYLASGAMPQVIRVTGLAGTSSSVHAFHYQDATHDHFVFSWGGQLYAANRGHGAIVASETSPIYPAGLALETFDAIGAGAKSFWVGFGEYSSADLTLLRQYDLSDWLGGSPTQRITVYDPVNHALITRSGSVSIYYLYLDRVAPANVLLRDICGDVAEWCGVAEYDFAALDQVVDGWSATRGPAANMIEPLLDAYDSDFRPHDFTIEGIKRTGIATGGTLDTAWFTGEPRYNLALQTELPRAVLIDFADINAEQQPNSVRSDRPLDATGARGEGKIDLTTLALDPTEARQLGNRYFRRLWNERKRVSLALTAKELKLEPGDVRTLSLDGGTDDWRCVKTILRADDTIATEWKYDHPSLATLDGSLGAAFDGRTPAVVVVPVLSKGFVLDVPLLSDVDDAAPPQVYALAGPYAAGAWPGAIIYQAVGGEYTDELAAVSSSAAATWGYLSAAMPWANPNLWDRGTSLTVTLQTGSLTGCTEAAANADPMLNLAAIGADGRWELVQFTSAVLTAPLTYTVSGFKRGRRGTEWAAAQHAAGDQFVLLETADVQSMGLSEVGTAVSFKPITAGRSSGFPFGYTFAGQSLMPYAPVHLEAVKQANGDFTLAWVRRTRVGGAWTSGSTIPLGEAAEAYEVDILDGLGAVVRTFAVSAATATYTAAEQTSDFGSEVADGALDWLVHQMSATVGRGFASEIA